MQEKGLTYADAGVDITAGYETVRLMKDDVKATYTPGVLGNLGGFGGLYSLKAFAKMDEPVLVSGTDGVGTKLRLAIDMDKHDTIGQDCVAMSVNDVLVQGALPLFFLDYVAVGVLDPKQVASVVSGVANACKESGCALLGGETAEMAGFYAKGDYDLAGFAVGIADKKNIITGENIKAGDILLGLPSSGVHSNGFSLVRKIVTERMGMKWTDYVEELGKSIGEALLEPTRLYPKVISPLFESHKIKGLAHITGGGFYENIPRVLPEGLGAAVDADSWETPKIFNLLQKWGQVETREMYRTFNMGIGMVVVVSPEDADFVRENFQSRGEEVFTIGEVITTDKEERVEMKGRGF